MISGRIEGNKAEAPFSGKGGATTDGAASSCRISRAPIELDEHTKAAIARLNGPEFEEGMRCARAAFEVLENARSNDLSPATGILLAAALGLLFWAVVL